MTLTLGSRNSPSPTAGVPTSLVLLQPAPGLGGWASLPVGFLPHFLVEETGRQEELSTELRGGLWANLARGFLGNFLGGGQTAEGWAVSLEVQ